MLDKKFLQQLRDIHSRREEERQRIIEETNRALHEAKRIIFALHRGERQRARERLDRVDVSLADLQKRFGFTRLNEEGSYKAAIEEYVEAKFFYKLLNGEQIGEIEEVDIRFDSYLAGLCDLPGELVRSATNEAAAGHTEKVEEYKKMVVQIMEELSGFDMTGYLRTKFDQAQSALRKIEQLDYEVKIRK